jgi:hypothetical protein
LRDAFINTPVALSQGLAFRILPETTTIRLASSDSAEENKNPLLKAQEEEKSIPASHLPDNEQRLPFIFAEIGTVSVAHEPVAEVSKGRSLHLSG